MARSSRVEIQPGSDLIWRIHRRSALDAICLLD